MWEGFELFGELFRNCSGNCSEKGSGKTCLNCPVQEI
nr:MAG TPA: hypothetical protein [Caudoviricetes sp.]